MASPYTIDVPDEKIRELRIKLSHATFPDELDGASWDLGTPLSEVKRLAKTWQTFDWRKAEAKLNALPNFHRTIPVEGFDDLDIHYIHQKSNSADAIPLLFVHGWPGGYIEVTKLLPELTQSSNDVAFDVVAPSLPNFGWSQGPRKRGFAIKQYAETCHKLMLSLGYKQYVTQAGDWGWAVTRGLGLLYPESCLASHLNGFVCNAPTFRAHPLLALQHAVTPYKDAEREGFARMKVFQAEGCGYAYIQSTKPQTLGYGLHDSPVALLAWIYEKLHDWTDDYPWTEEEILTWVSIYYFSTAGPAAAERIYYEVEHTDATTGVTVEQMMGYIAKVKLGLMRSPKEHEVYPWTWARTIGPVVFESDKSHGGHLAAYEHPEFIVSDLRKMFGKGGPCFQIIKR